MSLNDIGYVNSRVQTDLATNEIFGDTETDLNVVSTSRFQAPCAVLIGHRDAWHDPTITYAPEIIWVTEVPSGTVLRTTLANRGQSGTAVRTHDNAAGNLVATLIFDQRNWEELAAALLERLLKAGDTMSGPLDLDQGGVGHARLQHTSDGTRNWSLLSTRDDAGNRVDYFQYGPAESSPGHEFRGAVRANDTLTVGGADAAKINSGSYTGDDTTGRLISVGFNPRYVEIVPRETGLPRTRHWSNLPGGTIGHLHRSADNLVLPTTDDRSRPRLATGGFIVSGTSGYLNYSANTYDWVAWG